jgi:GNAT superfamily N-acetyltransferase
MITIRPAGPADLAQVVSLLHELMHHHGVQPPDTASLTASVSAIFKATDHVLLMAEEEGRSLGLCALIFSISTWSASPVCELQDVLVTEDRRRADIGRGLIEHAEQMARTRGCARLFLLAEHWNLEAHAFYRSLGLSEKTCLYFERDLRPV